jgi:ribosome-associated toxin RatA of RatAB toxin-antitoxin module
MKTVHKTVLIWYSAQEMYGLVTDVAAYPQFLPWCDQSRVLETHANGVTAEVGIAFAGIHQTFTTRNVHDIGRSVSIQLVKGPFSKLEGQWQFTPVGESQERACKVTLTLNYGFSSTTLARLIGPVFDKIASNLVDAFIKRAQVVYGA